MSSNESLSHDLADAITDVAKLLIREGVHVNRTALSVLGTLRAGPRRITDLAGCEFISQPAMTTLVSRLEEEGWVERKRDPTDGRAVNVAITKSGTATVEAALEARAEALRKRIAPLSQKDRDAVARAVDALRKLA